MSPPTDKEFGKRLRALMQAEGIDPAQLGEQIGITSATVQRWQEGKALPKIYSLLAIQKLYPLWNQEYLLTGRGKIMHQPHLASPPNPYPLYLHATALVQAYYGFKAEGERMKIPDYPIFAAELKEFLHKIAAQNDELLRKLTHNA